ncbi:dentin sialophosphoprotein-like [Vigna umbellata]|uniref:dentin sialophosphoprotein-like n=1 Tax=Vigna umbellata TaxID=87088 RepID=UPI001F5F39BC|nr:dentin sialophosphoprotein-like [Vigna umbellata]
MSYQSMEERKFVCKYCSKRFPCGKSLGGHIRTHMMSENSALGNAERSNATNGMFKLNGRGKRKRDLGSEENGGGGGGGATYGLRENPKKTTRFVHSNSSLQLEKFCKECGKGFLSLKALCGHMACHSEKDKGGNRFESSSSGFAEKQKLAMDSQSDTETSTPRRSKRKRFKTLSNSNNQAQSSVSEVEQGQEEVARCLMMLSKDSSYKGRFSLFTESSDNNSVVLEVKSPSPDTKVTMMNSDGKNFVSGAYEEKKLEQSKEFKYAEVGYDSDNSDSGYFRYGPKEVDSTDSNNGNFKNEVQSSKVGCFSGFEDYDVESRKVPSRSVEFKKFVVENWENDRQDGGAARKFDSKKSKKPNYESLGQNLVRVSSRKMGNGSGNDKVNKYECLTSERDNGYDDSAYESDENSTDSDSYPAPKAYSKRNLSGQKGKKKLKSKKSKAHECPICNKIFRSGQALGGHKRSHFIGGSEENTLVIRPGAAAVPCLIDLNLPAPVDE